MSSIILDYDLPPQRIAQFPARQRDRSRLLVFDRTSGAILHKRFHHLDQFLKPGDCLVINQTKVFPARLYGEKKDTGGKVEILLLKKVKGEIWESLMRPAQRVKINTQIRFPGQTVEATVLSERPQGIKVISFSKDKQAKNWIKKIGRVPLPPYIRRAARSLDQERYQTVYAKNYGSVAAPTAGLHFTRPLLRKLKMKGIHIVPLTLHIGLGTFQPIRSQNPEIHKPHPENYEIPLISAQQINQLKKNGNRIIAVGTSTVRALESAWDGKNVSPLKNSTDLFIHPPYSFNVIDGLITNFHLPHSTLLLLVAAFIREQKLLDLYQIAIKKKYRFYSYGDAMFII